MKQNGETTLADVVKSIKDLGDRLDGRLDELGNRLDGRLDELGNRLDGRLDELGNRLDGRIDGLDRRVALLDTNVNKRLDGVLKLLGGHHRDHEKRIAALEKSVAAIKKAS